MLRICLVYAEASYIQVLFQRGVTQVVLPKLAHKMWTTVVCLFLLSLRNSTVLCHIPFYASTPSNKVEQFCVLAETCVHDTISICGTMGEEKRTFLDLCDLLEYACDTNQIFIHVDDTEGCPEPRKKI